MTAEDREHDLNALAALLEGRLEAGERQRIVEHLGQCLECRDAAALLARSAEALRLAERDRAVSGRLAGIARSPWLGLAAVLVVGTAVAVRMRPSPPAAGSLPVPGPAPSRSPLQPSPDGEVPRRPTVERSPIAPPRTGTPAGIIDESLLAKRGGSRQVAGKTFRLVAGEWVDSAFDRAAAPPVVEVSGPAEREQVLARLPALAPYAALGERVLVVFEGRAYRFRPAGGR